MKTCVGCVVTEILESGKKKDLDSGALCCGFHSATYWFGDATRAVISNLVYGIYLHLPGNQSWLYC